MTYPVKEIFYTLQGRGTHTGRPAVFCRFSRCNLWTGGRRTAPPPICPFCDTDFVGTGEGGGRFRTPEELADAVESGGLPERTRKRFVVCTGGEPLLQFDSAASRALQARGFEVAIETNGTRTPPPEARLDLRQPEGGIRDDLAAKATNSSSCNPRETPNPERFESDAFDFHYLQPMDGPDLERNTQLAIEYCLAHPQWKLSVQSHKLIGVR